MVVLAGPAQWLGHSRKKCDEACKERLQRFTNHPFALWESNNSDPLDSGSTLRACIVLFRSGRGQWGRWAEVQRPEKLQRVPPSKSRRCPLNSCAQVWCPLDRLPQANSAPIFDQNIHVEGVDYNGDDFSRIRSRINSAALGSSSLKSSCRFSSRILLESLPLLYHPQLREGRNRTNPSWTSSNLSNKSIRDDEYFVLYFERAVINSRPLPIFSLLFSFPTLTLDSHNGEVEKAGEFGAKTRVVFYRSNVCGL